MRLAEKLSGESNGDVTTDQRRHVTLKGQGRGLNTLRAQYLENSLICYLATISIGLITR